MSENPTAARFGFFGSSAFRIFGSSDTPRLIPLQFEVILRAGPIIPRPADGPIIGADVLELSIRDVVDGRSLLVLAFSVDVNGPALLRIQSGAFDLDGVRTGVDLAGNVLSIP